MQWVYVTAISFNNFIFVSNNTSLRICGITGITVTMKAKNMYY